MSASDVTRIDTAADLERHLLEHQWSHITQNPGGSTLALICPLCNAMVPPTQTVGPDWRRHHIRYHVEDWQRIEALQRRVAAADPSP